MPPKKKAPAEFQPPINVISVDDLRRAIEQLKAYETDSNVNDRRVIAAVRRSLEQAIS